VKVRHWGAVVAAIMAMLVVAACGGGSPGAASTPRSSGGGSTASGAPTAVGSPPAAAILVRQVNSAVANARSVHITATVTQDGSTVGLNVNLTRSNEMSGDVIYKNEPLIVLVRNGRAYIKVTTGAVKAMGLPSAACVLMCGKYLEMTASQSRSLTSASWNSSEHGARVRLTSCFHSRIGSHQLPMALVRGRAWFVPPGYDPAGVHSLIVPVPHGSVIRFSAR